MDIKQLIFAISVIGSTTSFFIIFGVDFFDRTSEELPLTLIEISGFQLIHVIGILAIAIGVKIFQLKSLIKPLYAILVVITLISLILYITATLFANAMTIVGFISAFISIAMWLWLFYSILIAIFKESKG